MIAKNKYIFWESIITIASILLIAGLLRNALSVNFIYISVGLIGSLSFSWLVKGKFDNALKYAIAVGIFVILAWLIHSVLNSSLIYKDVVLLVVLRLFILEILLGLASFSPEILNCIQMLSVPLFMSHAVWIRQYDPASGLLILGCLFCWFLVLKIKFYHFFESINIPKLKKDHSIKLSIVFLAASALISWLFFSNILFNRTWGVGILTTEDKTGSDQLSEDTAEGKEFFVSQERFVEKIGNLIPKLESQQERG
ncbi:MAG: hypothetical protein KJ722_01250, partial [Candidatus Omnitrophica bacterium]|nr:hypothetical protein [Candidatus Omnitrophota bacterium]